jgi:uncharacterized damage-inducible protein DinB
MDAGVKGIAEHLDETWTSLLKSLDGVDDTLLQWSPGSDFNSVAILLRHLAGSERWWIGEAIGGVPSGRVRDQEFLHDAPGREDVLRAVEESRALTRRVLAGLTVQDLQSETTPTVTAGNPPRRPTKMWALLHYHEHLGYHAGQALLLLKLGRRALAGAAPRDGKPPAR